MREFRIRNDLERAVMQGFALPLGFEPGGFVPPRQGYTVAYNAAEGEEPDTYTFQAVVSHEKLAGLCDRCFDLLPDELFAIVEIGSRDAYRSVDVYLGQEPVSIEEFRRAWKHYEPFLLEDSSIAAGANADEPFVEVFVDQRKSVILHVPLSMRDDVETALQEFGLEEVSETWPDIDTDTIDEESAPRLRPVLDISDEWSPDVDELLLQLRHQWSLQLNLDPKVNTDEAGRELGLTLWHAVVIVFDDNAEGEGEDGAYLSIWLTASSLSETERLIREAIDGHVQYTFGDIYTVDRVAFDERPDQLQDLAPRRRMSEVHLVAFEPWTHPPEMEGGPRRPGRRVQPVTPDAEWYADGLRFECTQCGNCCTGPPGVVWVDEAEIETLVVRLGVTRRDFLQRYARRVNGRWSLQEHLTEHGYDCVFLDRETAPGKTLCRIHADRPAQCRTWPFWPENLRTPESWAETKRTTPCPGMDAGPLIPVESIRIQRDETPEG